MVCRRGPRGLCKAGRGFSGAGFGKLPQPPALARRDEIFKHQLKVGLKLTSHGRTGADGPHPYVLTPKTEASQPPRHKVWGLLVIGPRILAGVLVPAAHRRTPPYWPSRSFISPSTTKQLPFKSCTTMPFPTAIPAPSKGALLPTYHRFSHTTSKHSIKHQVRLTGCIQGERHPTSVVLLDRGIIALRFGHHKHQDSFHPIAHTLSRAGLLVRQGPVVQQRTSTGRSRREPFTTIGKQARAPRLANQPAKAQAALQSAKTMLLYRDRSAFKDFFSSSDLLDILLHGHILVDIESKWPGLGCLGMSLAGDLLHCHCSTQE